MLEILDLGKSSLEAVASLLAGKRARDMSTYLQKICTNLSL